MKRVLLFTGLMLLTPALSWAQGTTATTTGSVTNGKGDQAGATALFYEARNLMQKGNYKDACPKLEESLRLDYGIGTEFNLADCYEKLGKTASAWSGFLNVASQAKTQNQAQREKVARDRAKALEPKLPKMIIEVPAPPPGIEVKRDGVLVGNAAWGTAVPVDPGSHKVVVTAPNKQPWETSVTATEANTTRVTVPRELPNAPVAAAVVPPAAAKPTTAPVATPPVQTTTQTQTTVTEPPPARTASDFPEPVVERSNTQRTLGWVASGVGLVGLGVGAGFGLNSMAKRRESNDHCEGNLCNQTGVDLRDDAIRSGNVATVATIGGGVALVGGILLLVTAPSSERRQTATTGTSASTSKSKGTFTAVPSVAQGGGGLMLQGVFQ
jgi:hypothetical protein